MFARVSIRQLPNGRHSATITGDGMPSRHTSPHHSVATARSAGITLASALGRTVAACLCAAVVIAGGADARADDARRAGYSIRIQSPADMPIPCATATACADIARQFGCVVGYHLRGGLLLACDAEQFRTALSRHSA